MTSTLRAVAEGRFAALTRREDTAMGEVEAERQATREKTERLRALRLAQKPLTPAEHAAILKQRRAD